MLRSGNRTGVRVGAALVAAVLLAPALGAADEAALAGNWTATAAERDGAPATDVIGHRLSVEGDAFSIVGADGAPIYAGTIAADTAETPHHVDFSLATGEAWEGIWRLEGDTLTIADNAPDPDGPRPAGFDAPAGSGVVVVTFERDG